jgi:hypothetical protein
VKICTKCNTPKEDRKFRLIKKKNGKSYRRGECRACCEHPRKPGYWAQYAAKYRANPVNRARVVLGDSRKWDKKHGFVCDLTLADVQCILAPGVCTYCGESGIPLGLDRRDNSVGHVRDNVVAACTRCNLMRGTMPLAAWLFLVPYVSQIRRLGLFGDWRPGPWN